MSTQFLTNNDIDFIISEIKNLFLGEEIWLWKKNKESLDNNNRTVREFKFDYNLQSKVIFSKYGLIKFDGLYLNRQWQFKIEYHFGFENYFIVKYSYNWVNKRWVKTIIKFDDEKNIYKDYTDYNWHVEDLAHTKQGTDKLSNLLNKKLDELTIKIIPEQKDYFSNIISFGD